jgi:Flp pilus assembly protein TadG
VAVLLVAVPLAVNYLTLLLDWKPVIITGFQFKPQRIIEPMKRFLKQKRSGQAIVEMCFSLIMFAIMISLISTLCVFLYVQSNLITAAREGARVAASDPNFKAAGTVATGITNVKNRVTSYFTQTTAQTIPNGNITVTGPTGAVGYRNMLVQVNFTLNNPIPIGSFLAALGVDPTVTDKISTISMTSSASTRYEE